MGWVRRQWIRGAIIGAISLSVWPAAGAETANSFPDFSGVWWRNAMDPELPAAGAKPLINLMRHDNDPHLNGGGDPLPLVGDYNNPILKPQAAEAVKKAGQLSAGGRINPDPSNQCAPFSPPYIFTIQLGVQMLQRKDEIVMLYPQDDQVRRVRMNAAHPKKVIPSAMGDSVGHYEGDTLVIDTVGVKVGRVTMVDRYGTPQSEALHLVERYRLIDGMEAKDAMERHQRRAGPAGAVPFDANYGGLQLQYTVEDPNEFTMPWSAQVTYRRTMIPWAEQVCAENIVEYWPGMNIGVPKADKPDF
ncbi:MAG TPA: hypothetical protein VHT51_05910 [Micropepsaceae bacterium]|jgi:hypothetical protein|nr:hypothetical protein [Micropepsaceae bacterium]